MRSAVAVSRAANAFTRDEQPVSLLVTVAMADEQPTAVLNRLSKLLLDKKAEHLLKADAATVLALLTSDDAIAEDVLSAEFVVRNEHGLHARPGTMLVNTIKQFSSDITVTNLDGSGKPANGRSLMKVVALGVKKVTVCVLPRRVRMRNKRWMRLAKRSPQALGGRINEQTCSNDYVKPGIRLVGFTPEIERGEVNWCAPPACTPPGKALMWRKC